MLRAPLPALVAALALPAALALSACDTAPGPDGPRNAAPTVANLAVTPTLAFREDLPASGTAASPAVRVPLSATATVADPENRLDSVLLVVENPALSSTGRTLAPLVRVPMTASGGTYSASANLNLAATAYGGYRVLVVAKDKDGRLGEAVALLSYGTRGQAPVVSSAVATVSNRTVTVVATVADPDGLADIVRVEGVPASNPNGGDTFVFFDNGQGADQAANDGRYTAQFLVDGTGAVTLRLLVRALDRLGLKSADVLVEARVG